MTADQRKRNHLRFLAAPLVILEEIRAATNSQADAAPSHGAISAATSTKRTSHQLCKLSILPEESQIEYPPYSIVEEIFIDASALISTQGIMMAPGTTNTFIVVNTVNPRKPYVLQADGKAIQCTRERCLKYAAYDICSHTIAVAEHTQKLGEYIVHFNHKNRHPVSSLIDIGYLKKSKEEGYKIYSEQKRASKQSKGVNCCIRTTRQPTCTKSSGKHICKQSAQQKSFCAKSNARYIHNYFAKVLSWRYIHMLWLQGKP
eukprot:Seg629.9 transcript_id=Seg629.9/GoldUCD/mRNA.D3Y31 product="hypothetical protein" protein_id=Seg629.9/GoldUCD/D3Y31